MIKKIQIISIACILMLVNACTKDADVKLPVVESKLVINSFISPQDTIIKVEVTLSQPLYNNTNSGQHFYVTDANVQINDGVTTKTLIYNSIENYYSISSSQFPISVGTTYFLTVSTPDGKNVNASTSVPAGNSTLTFTSHLIINSNQADSTYSIEAKWDDATGSEDYYRIVYYAKQYYSGDIDTTYYTQFSDNFSDQGNDGRSFIQNFEVYKTNSAGNSGELYLIRASYEYYLFHTKLMDAANSGGPFSEPIQMYSNINGGHGIFGGFNQYKLAVFL